MNIMSLCLPGAQTETARVIGESLRKKILGRLKEMGNPEQELTHLFDQIDVNGSLLLRFVSIVEQKYSALTTSHVCPIMCTVDESSKCL